MTEPNTEIPEWEDGALPPPYHEKGGFTTTEIGTFHKDTPLAEIKKIAEMPGVDVRIVKEDGHYVAAVDVNTLVTPKK